MPWPRSLRLWSWCTCVLTAGHPGSRRHTRGVALSGSLCSRSPSLPGSLHGHPSWDSGLGGRSRRWQPPEFSLSLHGSAWVPWSRDSLTRKQNGLSLPDPPRRKNQDYKPRTLLHREGPTGSSGHPHPSLILFFWRGGEVLWAVPPSTQGLSSLTGGRPRAPALGVWSLNHSSHTEVPCPSPLI